MTLLDGDMAVSAKSTGEHSDTAGSALTAALAQKYSHGHATRTAAAGASGKGASTVLSSSKDIGAAGSMAVADTCMTTANPLSSVPASFATRVRGGGRWSRSATRKEYGQQLAADDGSSGSFMESDLAAMVKEIAYTRTADGQ